MDTTTPSTARPLTAGAQPLPIAVLALALIALLVQTYHTIQSIYQGDFTAYWTAGRALHFGQDPYFWCPYAPDGSPLPNRTAYLYPPIVADIFRPIGLMDYYHAKMTWTIGQLLCLLTGIYLTARLLFPRQLLNGLAGLCAATVIFPPVTKEFERGQIDCLTFVLIVGGIFLWHVKKAPIPAAICLVLAGMCKLPTLILLAVPLALRDYKMTSWSAVALVAVFGLSIAVDGVKLNRQYWFHHLGAFASGPVEATNALTVKIGSVKITAGDPANINAQKTPYFKTSVVWDGRRYSDPPGLPTRGSFLNWYNCLFPRRVRMPASSAGFLITILAICMVGFRAGRSPSPLTVWFMFATGMCGVLVFHMLSWLMNYTWLIFCLPALYLYARERRMTGAIAAIAVSTVLMYLWWQPAQAHALWMRAYDRRFCFASVILWVISVAMAFTPVRKSTEERSGVEPATPAEAMVG